ncbi:MAG: metallophosphoesterase [Blastocatellia bacterium]
MRKLFRRLFCIAIALLGLSVAASGQSEPFITHDTKPVITHGPYLLAPTETSITIVWMTDTPCHSKIRYGVNNELTHEVEVARHGLLPVGTRHAATITGLKPGQTYQYRVVSTRVVKLKAYWPEKGLAIESPVYSFTTFDRRKPAVSFSLVTDTHEDVARINALMKLTDWKTTDFLVHTGDAFHWIESEDQLFSKWLDPISQALAQTKPLIFARGNHDLRGPFARELFDYTPTPEGRFYYARDHGPVHLLVIDTGEDKPDDTNVYARLNRLASYREEEFAWFQRHVETDKRLAAAPFRIIVMHQPHWGWVNDQNAKWTELANKAKVDLVIAGHRHRFSRVKPGERGNDFPILVVGQDQVARVDASSSELKVVVTAKDGSVVDSFTVPAKSINQQ